MSGLESRLRKSGRRCCPRPGSGRMGTLVLLTRNRVVVAGICLLALFAVPPGLAAKGQGDDCSEYWKLTAPHVPYFPPGAFGPSADHIADSYSCYLQAMGERSLLNPPARDAPETYRLLVVPAWQRPIVVRLVIRPDGTGALFVKASMSQQEASTLTVDRVQSVSKEGTQTFLRLLVEAHFWSMSTLSPPNHDPHVIAKTMDGIEWVLEGGTARRYHVVTRTSPRTGPYWAVVSYLFRELANLRMPPAPIIPKGR